LLIIQEKPNQTTAIMYNPHKAAQGYYMLDSRYRQAGYFPQEYDPHRFPMAPMIVAHPAAHYPQMPWTGGDGGPALQPVFINPSDYQQMLQNQQNRPGSVDSESSSSKNSSRRGSMNQKFVPSVMQNKKMQLAEIEEMAQQADRMRISEKKHIRERRPSNGSSADSGTGGFPLESEEGNYEVPSDELAHKIIDQVEFYLSDEYLAKDKYLLRQIRCKSEGYISIKLMTSFKKVKKLTRDWQVVRHALRLAEQLEVSPEGYRVKRRDNLPETLRKPRMLTSVVAIRVPEDFGSVDQITSMFRPYGIIALVRLLRKGKDIPSDLRNYATQVPDIGNSLCAVVDFDGSDAALKAVRELKEKYNDTGMRLALLGPRMRRTLYRQDRLNGSSRGSEDGSSTCGESITASDVSKESGFDNKSEISEGERSSPGILMKQKQRAQQSMIKQREPVGPDSMSRGFGLARSQIA
jgi:hypothetical protein